MGKKHKSPSPVVPQMHPKKKLKTPDKNNYDDYRHRKTPSPSSTSTPNRTARRHPEKENRDKERSRKLLNVFDRTREILRDKRLKGKDKKKRDVNPSLSRSASHRMVARRGVDEDEKKIQPTVESRNLGNRKSPRKRGLLRRSIGSDDGSRTVESKTIRKVGEKRKAEQDVIDIL